MFILRFFLTTIPCKNPASLLQELPCWGAIVFLLATILGAMPAQASHQAGQPETRYRNTGTGRSETNSHSCPKYTASGATSPLIIGRMMAYACCGRGENRRESAF